LSSPAFTNTHVSRSLFVHRQKVNGYKKINVMSKTGNYTQKLSANKTDDLLESCKLSPIVKQDTIEKIESAKKLLSNLEIVVNDLKELGFVVECQIESGTFFDGAII
jgi:predicted transcriptional regulator